MHWLKPCFVMAALPVCLWSAQVQEGSLDSSLGLAVAKNESLSQDSSSKYQRSSITFVPLLWRMDEQSRAMPRSLTPRLIQSMQSALVMPRFDVNAIPEVLENRFMDSANVALANQWNMSIERIAQVMDRTLVEEIRRVMDLELQSRASKLMTEAQRNSFIVDKAKEMGYTEAEVQKVLNSAYILLPLAEDYQLNRMGQDYQASIRMGLLIFKINQQGDHVQTLALDPRWIQVQGYGATPEIAQVRMAELSAQNLKRIVRDMPEFKIQGRLQKQFWTSLQMNLGALDGVRIDDKYRIVEQSEDAQGRVKSKSVGWAIVQKTDPQSSKLRLLGGRAGTDFIVQEIPQLNMELQFSLVQSEWGFEGKDSTWNWKSPLGLHLESRYSLAHSALTSQLFGSVGVGLSPAVAEIPSMDVSSPVSAEIHLGLHKRFYPLPYLSLELGSDLAYQYMSMALESSQSHVQWDLEASHLEQKVRCATSVLLNPALSLGVSLRWNLWDLAGMWKDQNSGEPWTFNAQPAPVLRAKGPEIGLSLDWSPSSLAFDPIQLIQRIF